MGKAEIATAPGDPTVELGLLVMITAALPITIRLVRRGRTSLRHFAAAGAVLGNFPFAVYLWIAFGFAIVHLLAGTLGSI